MINIFIFFCKKDKTILLTLKYTSCGCPRTEDEFEELQYDFGNVTVHGPGEERHSRKGGDESKYSKGFQMGARVWRVKGRASGYKGSFWLGVACRLRIK